MAIVVNRSIDGYVDRHHLKLPNVALNVVEVSPGEWVIRACGDTDLVGLRQPSLKFFEGIAREAR